MSYARDDEALPPVLSDADWAVDFEFVTNDEGAPLDVTGSSWSLTFALQGRRRPAAADVHELTTDAGAGLVVADNVVAAAWRDFADWTPGVYDVELRKVAGESRRPYYVGEIDVARGLSDVADLGGGGPLPATTSPSVRLVVEAETIRVIRGEAAGTTAAAVDAATRAEAAADAAEGDATATAADRVQTGLDRVATAADRAATLAAKVAADADAAATAADRTATHADKLAADADATATAADRVQTGLDRVATAADRTATLAAKVAADADAAATAADRAATHADKLAADADATATAADRVQTGLDRVATAADRVQTGLDRAAAAASDAAAAASALVAGGVGFTFSTTTTDADPGNAGLRFNNATIASVTQLFVDNQDVGARSTTAWLDSFDDVAANADRGRIYMVAPVSGKIAVFKVNGGVVDGTGYRKVSVAYVAGVLPTNGERVNVAFVPSGADTDAATVASNSDAYRYGRATYETEVGSGLRVYPTQKQRRRTMNLNGNTLNADGTITIAAGSYIVTENWNTAEAQDLNQRWYAYAVAVRRDVGTALRLQASFNSAAVIITADSTLTRPFPGVAKLNFRNWSGGAPGSAFAWFNVRLYNDSGAAVTVYPLELYTTDNVYLPQIVRYDRAVDVPPQAVRNFDQFWERWGAQLRMPRHLAERLVTSAADSVAGASGNAGTSIYAPKAAISQLAAPAQGSIVGLGRGSTFRENLPAYGNGNPKGLVFTGYAFGAQQDQFPVVSSLDQVASGAWVDNGDGTWKFEWTGTVGADGGVLADTNYDMVYAVEINSTTEAATPIASRRQMTRLTSQAAVAAAAGSMFIQNIGANQWRATIRPSDGLAPGAGAYRYEITKRYCPINFLSDSARDGAIAGLRLEGGTFGYGQVAGTERFVGERLVLVHASAHQIVFKGGLLQHGVSYAKGPPTAGGTTALTCYTDLDPTGKNWAVRNWLGYDVGTLIYNHTSDTTKFFSLAEIENIVIEQTRASTGELWGLGGIGGVNTAQYNVRNCYVRGLNSNFSFGSPSVPSIAEVQDCLMRECAQLQGVPSAFHDNIVQVENWSDAGNVNSRGMKLAQINRANSHAYNNIFYAKKTTPGNGLTDFTADVLGNTPVGQFDHNVVLLGPGLTAAYMVTAHPNAATAFTSDYNVVINCASSENLTAVKTGSTPTTDWAGYQALFGQDAHSLYVDLRDDPRGVKAVFMDPDNGDFRWAQTDVGKTVRDFCVANGVGPRTVTSRWPSIPTVDRAAQLLRGA